MVADISKVSAAFMWRPLVDLKDGLNLIVATLDDISSWNLHSKNIG